ncbi:MAG: ABC transporter ATP-binding protein [Chitinophagaceae bacterium]
MSDEQKKKGFNFLLLRQIFTYVKPYNKYLYGSVLLALLMAFIAPIRPYLIQLTVDKATGKNVIVPNWLQAFFTNAQLSNLEQFIIAITLFQIAFIFIETAIRFVFTFITAWLGQNVVKDLRSYVFSTILNLPLNKFDTTPIGTLTTRTINDIESINDIFSDGLIPIIADLLTIVFTLFTMFWIDWKLTLVALIPFPIIIIATSYFKKSVNKSYHKVRNAVANLNSFVQEHIAGMTIVQAFTAEDREFKKFKKINAEHRDANIKAIFAYSVFFPIVELVLAFSTALIIWWVLDNRTDAPINFSGKIVAFVMYMNLIFRPLRILADKFNVLQMGMIAAERVFKITSEERKEELGIGNWEKRETNAKHQTFSVEFKNVWFAYSNENYVLKNISFEAKAGETLALVGHTGSGKTSIISLINKLYPINKGNILINNQNIDNYGLEDLRLNVGVVLQDVFLFSGSIMDNITLRNASITKAQVIEAATLIGMHNFIMQLPNNYDYNVMERGNILSMGQRQLISFIRVLLYNPSILILDEATSSIDTESEQLIQQAINTLIKGRTSIVIAHRLSTITKANKIIVLDKGEIKEQGTHSELLMLKGYYSDLYHRNFEGKATQ